MTTVVEEEEAGEPHEEERDPTHYEETDWNEAYQRWGFIDLVNNPKYAAAFEYFVSLQGKDFSRDFYDWETEWNAWDIFYAQVDPAEHRTLRRKLWERRQKTDQERAANIGKDYVDVDEMDETAVLVNPPPEVIRVLGSRIPNLIGGMLNIPGQYSHITNYDADRDDPDGPPADGNFGDEAEEHLRLNPFELQAVPNPVPAPPESFTPWRSWPPATCTSDAPPDPQILPNFFMLLCPDGLRRDHVGNFGMDSLLAKIKNRRQIVFRNYSVIPKPGRLGRLTFEVIDSGFNRVINTKNEPALIRMGFMYEVINTEQELSRYL